MKGANRQPKPSERHATTTNGMGRWMASNQRHDSLYSVARYAPKGRFKPTAMRTARISLWDGVMIRLEWCGTQCRASAGAAPWGAA